MKQRHLLRLCAVMLLIGVSLVSCTKTSVADVRFNSLFRTTDHFVNMLDTMYEHYDALGKKATDSSDGKYTVTPIGRLIVVKRKYSTTPTNKEIAAALSAHYASERKVKKVFENDGGTVTIDCRK